MQLAEAFEPEQQAAEFVLPAFSAVIDQPDSPTGKTGKGHEDAWRGNRSQPITV